MLVDPANDCLIFPSDPRPIESPAPRMIEPPLSQAIESSKSRTLVPPNPQLVNPLSVPVTILKRPSMPPPKLVEAKENLNIAMIGATIYRKLAKDKRNKTFSLTISEIMKSLSPSENLDL